MKKIKVFLPIIIIIFISSVFILKNSGFMSNNDAYVVSETEDKNNDKDINKNKDKINNNIEKNLDSSVKNSDLKSVQKINDDKSINKKMTIYISGAVKSPKVVEIDSKDRLMDGVTLCGGVSDDADMNKINMAMKVEDGGHYIIPKIGEENINSNDDKNINKDINLNSDNKSNNKDKININSASITELDSLPGVGAVTAQKIIDYRDENTSFKSIDEIKNVKGIGENKFNDMKDYICIQ